MDKEKRVAYEKLLAKLKKSLTEKDWDVSLFFRGMGKRVQNLHDKLTILLAEDATVRDPKTKVDQKARENCRLIYLSVYQTDGNNLRKWATVLASVQKLSIGRPAYEKESAARAVVRAKAQQQREGYIAVWVNNEDVLPAWGGKVTQDRFGHDLLTLREGAILPENIDYFQHTTGQYYLADGQLVLADIATK